MDASCSISEFVKICIVCLANPIHLPMVFAATFVIVIFIPLFGFPLALTFALYGNLTSPFGGEGSHSRCIRWGWLLLALRLTHTTCKISLWSSRFLELMFRWCAIASLPCCAMPFGPILLYVVLRSCEPVKGNKHMTLHQENQGCTCQRPRCQG